MAELPGPGTARHPDETDLSACLRAGEARAFDGLVERYGNRVFRQAVFLLGSVQDAEDVAQEVFVKVFHALPSFQGNRLGPWLAVITRHHCLDERRKARRRVPQTRIDCEALPAGTPPPEAGDTEALLAGLSVPEREVLNLHLLEGMPYREIANVTGYAEGTLRNVLSQALRKLREGGARR